MRNEGEYADAFVSATTGQQLVKHQLLFRDSRFLSTVDIRSDSIHLIVTSPPYPKVRMWDQLFLSRGLDKYEEAHDFLEQVWRQCFRVLIDGGIACINVGDATRSIPNPDEMRSTHSQDQIFKLFANHSDVIQRCEKIGFQSLPYILWKKPTTRPKYKGKTVYLGSGFLPTNAYVTLDVEYILIFRKGSARRFQPGDKIRYESQYTKEQRDKWFSQIWTGVVGTRQRIGDSMRRTAAFPEEIPRRLIQMFSIKGDIVLDPFLGTGTTMKAAAELDRCSIGVEFDETLLPVILHRIGYYDQSSPIAKQGLHVQTEKFPMFQE